MRLDRSHQQGRRRANLELFSAKHVSDVRPWKSISVVVLDSSYDLYVDVLDEEDVILRISRCYVGLLWLAIHINRKP